MRIVIMKKQILRVAIMILSVCSLSGMIKPPPSQMNYKNIVLGMLNNLINQNPLSVSAYSAPELQELIKSVDALQKDPAEIKSLSRQMMLDVDIVPVYLADIKQQAQDEIQKKLAAVPAPKPKPGFLQPLVKPAPAKPAPAPVKPAEPVQIKNPVLLRPSGPTPQVELRTSFLIDQSKVPQLLLGAQKLDQNHTLIQIKTVDQTQPPLTRFKSETCPVLALRNAALLLRFGARGNYDELKKIDNVESAQEFMMSGKVGSCVEKLNLLTTEEIDKLLYFAVEPALLNYMNTLDSVIELGQSGEFLAPEIAAKNKKMLAAIQEGMRKPHFVYSLILGDSEYHTPGIQYMSGSRMHYIAFTIIKAGDKVQYIVADTLGNNNHLQGVDRAQLIYLINVIEHGFSQKKFDEYITFLTKAAQEKQKKEKEYEEELKKAEFKDK